MNKLNVSYLREDLKRFVSEKYAQIKAAQAIETALNGLEERCYAQKPYALETLCQELNLTRNELLERFISPWEALSAQQIEALSYYWNMVVCPGKNLLMEMTPTYEHQALQWTVVNVCELNLFDVFLKGENNAVLAIDDPITFHFWSEEQMLPYLQCCYCGRLDEDNRGKLFKAKRLRFCHTLECTSESNANGHPSGCCYGEWRRLKLGLRLQIKRNQANVEKVRELFWQFCEKRYTENQKIKQAVRVSKKKPKGWRRPDDGLFSQVHPEGVPQEESESRPFFFP